MAMPGHVVAEQDDDIRVERIGTLDNRLDTVERHPGVAGMQVGDDGDLEPEIGGPLRRLYIVARDAKPQFGLAKTIGDGGSSGSTEAGEEAKEMAARNHED